MAPSQAKQLAGLFVAVIIFFVLLVVVRAAENHEYNGHVSGRLAFALRFKLACMS